ncbi:hypothetical protein OK016_30255 [Vibrio chagasii]|nr:hypothetical protein [Vibrio chagasii]
MVQVSHYESNVEAKTLTLREVKGCRVFGRVRVYDSAPLTMGFGFTEIAGAFCAMAIIPGLVAGLSPIKICEY